MRKAPVHDSLALIAAFALTVLTQAPAVAQSTAFTYQGSLDDAGVPANGLHDFRFKLFDASTGGTQLGSLLCSDNVSVTKGVFTAQLDFGQQFATTAQRYLEVEVRRDTGLTCANATGFAVLAPRHQLTATPMATHANSAFALDAADGSPTNAVFVDPEGRVGIGTTTPEFSLDVNGSFRWGGAASEYAWSANDGGGLFIEQAGNSVGSSGIRLQASKSSDWTNYSQFLMNPYTGFSFMDLGTGRSDVGIGTLNPTARLDVRGDIRLGPTGQYRAAAGEENLRLLRGTVGLNGAIYYGTGFSATRVALGRYIISFSSPFSSEPSVTVTLRSNPAMCSPFILFVGTGTFTLDVYNVASGVLTDASFDFCVMGPR